MTHPPPEWHSRVLEDLTGECWDVAVVGAGPAGAMAAHQLACAGARVLIIERGRLPRAKVCGCCFGASALAALERVGLGTLLAEAGARPYHQIQLASGGRSAVLEVPPGAAMLRSRFDLALLEAAARAGACVCTGTVAELIAGLVPAEPVRRLRLSRPGADAVVEARVVLACDGLAGGLLRREQGHSVAVAPGARVGVGAVSLRGRSDQLPEGTILMACGRGGYAGMVQLEGGELDLAAAIDPQFLRARRSPGQAVAAILEEAGVPPVEDLESLAWSGTQALTRRPARLGAHRVLAVGDAAGYVEPFTGDGIAWALTGAQAVVPLALAGIESWEPLLPARWQRLHRSMFARRQALCRRLGWMLRRPLLTGMAVAALGRTPGLSRLVTRPLARPIPTT